MEPQSPGYISRRSGTRNWSSLYEVESGVAQNWSKTAENWQAVKGFKVWQRCIGAWLLTAAQEKPTLNSTGIGSENTFSQIFRLSTGKPWERLRSNVCPCWYVGPDTHCTRLKNPSPVVYQDNTHVLYIKIASNRDTIIVKHASGQKVREVIHKVLIIFMDQREQSTQNRAMVTAQFPSQ